MIKLKTTPFSTINEIHKELIIHFSYCSCEDCGLMAEYGTWRAAYAKGYRAPRHTLPVVWKHHKFTVDFEFYVQRGFVNAMIQDNIEDIKEHWDAPRFDRRK